MIILFYCCSFSFMFIEVYFLILYSRYILLIYYALCSIILNIIFCFSVLISIILVKSLEVGMHISFRYVGFQIPAGGTWHRNSNPVPRNQTPEMKITHSHSHCNLHI